MSLHIHYSSGSNQLDILGSFSDKEQCDQFASQLIANLRHNQTLQIGFYDALTLPREVIESLAAALDQGYSLQILTYHRYLTHTLLNMQLPVQYVPHHIASLNNTPPQAIVIGGSADSLEKLFFLIEQLPRSDIAIFIVQHLAEDFVSNLDALLKVRTDYHVVMPHTLCQIASATIYIAPPGFHMKVANGMIYLTRDAKVAHARPSIDVLFSSLAQEYSAALIGVLLCGMSVDGVSGMQVLRQHGATALLQESNGCPSAPFLTNEVRQQGAYDYVMGIFAIGCYLVSALQRSDEPLSDQLLTLFLQAISARYGYDYSGYHNSTVRRRISKLMESLHINVFHDFQRQVLTDPGVFQRFYLEMSVEVTSFFRHPEQFALLRQQILGYLTSFPRLKIWSAGCASGEEIYSIAMLLDEMGLLERSQLYATDINLYAVEQAKAGLFPVHTLSQDRANYLASGGSCSFDNWIENSGRYLKIADRYRKKILFYHHSLIHDGVFNEFQLIFCRNVLIYFKSEQQQQILQQLARSLHRDGFLVLGATEGFIHGKGAQLFRAVDSRCRIYRLAEAITQ